MADYPLETYFYLQRNGPEKWKVRFRVVGDFKILKEYHSEGARGVTGLGSLLATNKH